MNGYKKYSTFVLWLLSVYLIMKNIITEEMLMRHFSKIGHGVAYTIIMT